jgi:hypothetical protein
MFFVILMRSHGAEDAAHLSQQTKTGLCRFCASPLCFVIVIGFARVNDAVNFQRFDVRIVKNLELLGSECSEGLI